MKAKPRAEPDTPCDGPTPEQMRGDQFERSDARMNRDRPFTRVCACLLDQMHVKGKCITARQVEAGKRFAIDHAGVWSQAGRDSSLQPIGGITHETEGQAARIAAARQRMDKLESDIGAQEFALVRQVAVYEQRMKRDAKGRNMAALRHGLDGAARVYGLE